MSVGGDLVAFLDAAGLGVPVRPPGSSIGTLPAVVVVPADDTVGEGTAYLIHGYDVTVIVPRASATDQLSRLEALTVATVRALAAGSYAVGPRLRYSSGEDESVHYLSRVIPVAHPSEVFC